MGKKKFETIMDTIVLGAEESAELAEAKANAKDVKVEVTSELETAKEPGPSEIVIETELEKNDLQRQLDEANKKASERAAEYTKLQHDYVNLKNRNAEAESAKKAAEAKAAEAEQAKEAAEERAEKAEKAKEAAEKAAEEAKAKAADFKKQLDDIEKTHQGEISDLEETHKNELQGQINAGSDKLNSQKSDYEQKLRQKDDDREAEMAKLEEAHREELKKLEATHRTEIDAKVEAAKAELTAENKKLKERIAELERSNLEGVAYQAMTSELTAFVKKEDASFAKDSAKLDDDFGEALDALMGELDALMGEHQKSRKALQKDHEAKLAAEGQRIINDSIAKVKADQEARAQADQEARELREDEEYRDKLDARIEAKKAKAKAEVSNGSIEA